MGVERIRQLAASLIAGGMGPGTPGSMVRWGTTGRQRSSKARWRYADIVAKQFKAPAVTVIGGVVNLRGKLNWFEQRPLFGQRVVTRARRGTSQLGVAQRVRGECWSLTIRVRRRTTARLAEAMAGRVKGLVIFTVQRRHTVLWVFQASRGARPRRARLPPSVRPPLPGSKNCASRWT